MHTYYSNPGLDIELDYRRGNLRRAAADHRLTRQAREGARTGRRSAGRRTAH